MLEEHLQKISSSLSLMKLNAAKLLANEIMNEVLNRLNRQFADQSVKFTDYYLYDVKPPDEFDFIIKIDDRNDFKPMRDSDIPGCVRLKGGSNEFVQDDYVQNYKVQNWINQILHSLFYLDYLFVNGVNDNYFIYFRDKKMHARCESNSERTIYFYITPSFVFNTNQWCYPKPLDSTNDRFWLAAPPRGMSTSIDNNEKVFMIFIPNFEKEILVNKINLNKSLRMMIRLRDAHNMRELSNFILKTLYLGEEERQNDAFWEKPFNEIIFHMLHKLICCLKQNNLPYYFDRNVNVLSQMSSHDRLKYVKILDYILIMLESCKENVRVSFDDVEKLFK